MPILSDSAMQSLANLAIKLAGKDDCIIKRNSTSNGQLVTTVVAEVKCVVLNPSGQPATVEDWNGNIVNWPVLLPLGSVVEEGDILTIKGQNMEVQRVETLGSYAVFDKVIASGIKA